MMRLCRRIHRIMMILMLIVSSIGCVAGAEPPQLNLCRVSGGQRFKPELFALYSCAKCYRHMDARLFANGTKLEERGVWLRDPSTGQTYLATYENRSSPVFGTFRTAKQTQLWIDCCKAAERCCNQMTSTPPPSPDAKVCPRTWDGWSCWPDTPAGAVQENRCPSYIYFNSELPQCTRYAAKVCWDNATWYRNSRMNEFSDYSTCGQGEDIKLLLKTHLITFGISIVLLVPALGIFFYFRQLRVHRIFMHKNLFLSLLLTAVCVTIYESYFIRNFIHNSEDSILESNQAGCKLFYALTKYLRLSTYAWMFCEGFYLHKLIAAAFAEQKSVLIFHLIGWGLPAVPVGIWAVTRHQVADELCWTVPYGHIEWIIYAPMLLALVVNFCFLVHIVQIIITKLRSTNTDEPAQFRRAVRATMVLVPLFGLHFLLLSYHPRKDCHVLLIYNVATYLLDGLQGGIVSLLFCYFNNEVLFLIKRSYNRKLMIREINSHMSSRKKSRTSVSTNVESIENEVLRKK